MSLKDIKEIKKSIDNKKIVIGLNKTIKNIKQGNISKVYLSNNCPKNIQNDIKRYSKIAKISSVVLNKSNEDLGVICKKPFSISVLSIVRDNNEKDQI